ncbi:hypothetical protein BX070DRAFT_114247 [Coemansia spiralis]|nr:hypothetical protein BX070DRAFT_114247 [Coemansia spiralis]
MNSSCSAFRSDIGSLFDDHVKNADIVSNVTRADVSQQMLYKAAATASQNTDAQVVFIECGKREAFAAAVGKANLGTLCTPSEDTAVGGNGCADALSRIAIRYTSTTETFCALLAAWHYHTGVVGNGASGGTGYTEKDFLLWDAGDAASAGEIGDGQETLPDYVFIDGIDEIASTDSMPYIWALLNNTLDYINRVRLAKNIPGACRLIIGLVEDDF